MGANSTKVIDDVLSPKMVERIRSTTKFSEKEIEKLFYVFKNVSSSIQNDGVIDHDEFQASLGFRNSECARRVFNAFDLNGDKVISFEEFCMGVAHYAGKTSTKEKIKFCFKLFDMNRDGSIDKNELFLMLRASLFENSMLELSDRHVKAIVDETFNKVDSNGDGKISFEEFAAYMEKNSALLDSFTLDIKV